jgi:hypothetical protein
LEAFVLTYRMLTQNNDRYSIGRLAESYELAHYVFRNWFMYLRQETSSFLCTGSSLHIEGTAIPYRDILDVVIYGELAHSNKKKEATFAQWTRWPTHEQCLWLIFDHALRCAMKLLQHFRDVNVIALMAHFELLPDEETFRRLQHQGIIRTDAVFEQS